jgi:hypothetical protein
MVARRWSPAWPWLGCGFGFASIATHAAAARRGAPSRGRAGGPPAVVLSMLAVFRSLRGRSDAVTAYNVGFAVYWGGWCLEFPPHGGGAASGAADADRWARTWHARTGRDGRAGRRRGRHRVVAQPSADRPRGGGDDGRLRGATPSARSCCGAASFSRRSLTTCPAERCGRVRGSRYGISRHR